MFSTRCCMRNTIECLWSQRFVVPDFTGLLNNCRLRSLKTSTVVWFDDRIRRIISSCTRAVGNGLTSCNIATLGTSRQYDGPEAESSLSAARPTLRPEPEMYNRFLAISLPAVCLHCDTSVQRLCHVDVSVQSYNGVVGNNFVGERLLGTRMQQKC